MKEKARRSSFEVSEMWYITILICPCHLANFYYNMADKNVQALLIPKDWDEMDAESESSLHKEKD